MRQRLQRVVHTGQRDDSLDVVDLELLDPAECRGRVEVEHVTPQNRIAAFETPTDDFTLVNASLSWKPFGTESETTLILSANNIFDVEARRRVSEKVGQLIVAQ